MIASMFLLFAGGSILLAKQVSKAPLTVGGKLNSGCASCGEDRAPCGSCDAE